MSNQIVFRTLALVIPVVMGACTSAVERVAPIVTLSPAQTAAASADPCAIGCLTEFHPASAEGLRAGDATTAIVTGSDGALWFYEVNTNQIGRITTDGRITEFPIPGPKSLQGFLAAAPDRSIWFTEDVAGKLGHLTADGKITEIVIPNAGTKPGERLIRSVSVAANGDVWYLARGDNSIGQITADGRIVEHAVLPAPPAGTRANLTLGAGFALDPDGSVWIINSALRKIERWREGTSLREYPVQNNPGPRIAIGPDGSVWFSEQAQGVDGKHAVGRIAPDGTVREYPLADLAQPIGITVAPDGTAWFTEYGIAKIARMTPDGTLTEFPIPTPLSTPFGITAGPDGNIWFTGGTSGNVGRIRIR